MSGKLTLIGAIALIVALVTKVPSLAAWNESRGDRAYLDERLGGLVGKTGLDPFDPVSPLAGTELVSLDVADEAFGFGRAAVRFRYANGESRDYAVSTSHHQRLRGGWQYSSLDRLYAPHEELPGLPLAGADAPFHLGNPVPIPGTEFLAELASSLNWGLNPDAQSVWSPQGDALVVTVSRAPAPGVWLVPLVGGERVQLGEMAAEPLWNPDGTALLFFGRALDRQTGLVLVDRSGQVRWSVPLQAPVAFTTARDGALFVRDGALWRMPYDASNADAVRRVIDLPLLSSEMIQRGMSLALSPDGTGLAYACGPDICLTDLVRGEHTTVAGDALYDPSTCAKGPAACWPSARLSWSPEGRYLAVARFDQGEPPRLLILDRQASVILDRSIGPNGALDAPQWTPDGRFILMQAYPERGRRIVAVDVAAQHVYDLSQPGWDAVFSLAPDGDRMVLCNGRGGLWLATVEPLPQPLP